MKTLFHSIAIAGVLAVLSTTALAKSLVSLDIQAYIDGRDQLIIKNDTLQWHHFDCAAVGRHEGVNLPTIINGISNPTGFEWIPEWPSPPPDEIRFEAFSSIQSGVIDPLPRNGMPWQVEIVFGRGTVSIVEQPSAANDYALIIEFNDNPQGGAASYGVYLSVVQPDTSQKFYGIRGDEGEGLPADLITIDPTTGGLDTVIGVTGLTGVGGMAVSPINGTIYAVGGGAGTPGLHTLDPQTGAARFVGGNQVVRDMGFDSSGTLYAVLANNGITNGGELVTIDLTTGAVTTIGGLFIRGIGLAFDSNDTLYIKESSFTGAVFSRLYTVDPSTGAILNTVEIDQLLNNSLAFDAKDVLYSHQWEDPGVRIYTVDPVTGSTNGLPAKIPPLNQGGEEVDISTIDFRGISTPSPRTNVPLTWLQLLLE